MGLSRTPEPSGGEKVSPTRCCHRVETEWAIGCRVAADERNRAAAARVVVWPPFISLLLVATTGPRSIFGGTGPWPYDERLQPCESRPMSLFGAARLLLVYTDKDERDLVPSDDGTVAPRRDGAWAAWAKRGASCNEVETRPPMWRVQPGPVRLAQRRSARA